MKSKTQHELAVELHDLDDMSGLPVTVTIDEASEMTKEQIECINKAIIGKLR